MRLAALLSLLLLPLAACDTSGVDAPGERVVELGTFDIDPRGTYLRTHADTANAPTTIDLAALGVRPGDSLFVRILGEADLDPSASVGGRPGAASFSTLGVFSTSAAVAASDSLTRIPGAVDVPGEIYTGPTAIGALPTDIPEDVQVNRGAFRVPPGATTLFLSLNDQFFSDNLATTFTATLATRR